MTMSRGLEFTSTWLSIASQVEYELGAFKVGAQMHSKFMTKNMETRLRFCCLGSMSPSEDKTEEEDAIVIIFRIKSFKLHMIK